MGEARCPRGRKGDAVVAAVAFVLDLAELLVRAVDDAPASRIVVVAAGA
ncbi:hypothetical protein [Actinomadura terrae]|nr:hypothetical protein [Actinomadura terrae]